MIKGLCLARAAALTAGLQRSLSLQLTLPERSGNPLENLKNQWGRVHINVIFS